MPRFAQIAIALPIDRIFHYSIPDGLQSSIEAGKRVFVSFGVRQVVGYCVGFSEEADVKDVKPILGVIDPEPILGREMLELTRWIKDNYFCSWGEAMEAAVPSGIKKGKVSLGARVKQAPGKYSDIKPTGPLSLTPEQSKALKSIVDSIEKREHRTYLLYGITASGKTEVYLQAIEAVIGRQAQAIVLVPEISLTPQTIERFVSRFGASVAVLHSRLTPAKRYLEWKKIKDGRASIVVGARSAVFSPVKNLGIIILDEEHETSYKQEDVPRYNARDVAEERARISNCPLVLGSATPSLESYLKAKKGIYSLIRLTKRIDERMLPKVKIVDMRMELATRKRITIFSKVLLDAVDRALKAGKQVILFLNRRGFSTFVNCKSCGLVLKCKRCDTTLVYHYQTRLLLCHYCGYKCAPPEICPKCRGGYIRYFGLGTEKVESEIARVFPGARIARMDSDTTRKSGSHDRILGEFRTGKANILIGTQMVAKGHDFPQVTLVGVISADVSMNVPDFRADERTFNLLTQVAGRAGRGKDGGEVIVQTYAPGHYAVLTAARHDYEKFYQEEIVTRKELKFPPFVSLVKVTLRSRNEDAASRAAAEMADAIRRSDASLDIAGPAPAPMARLRGYYRYNVMLKGKDRISVCEALKRALPLFRKPHGVLVAVDVDPISM